VCTTTGSVRNAVIAKTAVHVGLSCNIEVLRVPFSITLYVYSVFYCVRHPHKFYHAFLGRRLGVVLLWPPKSLRSQEMVLGRKRLCTTDVNY